MTSIIISTTLDVTSTVIFWVAKKTGYGIYSGVRYMIFGHQDKTISKTELEQLTTEIKQLKSEIIELTHPKLYFRNINEDFLLIDYMGKEIENKKKYYNEKPPSYESISLK